MAKEILARTRRPAKCGSQNEAKPSAHTHVPHKLLAALALFRSSRQKSGLAQNWPGCRSYAVDCSYFGHASRLRFQPPTPWQLGSMQPSRQPNFALPTTVVVVSDGRAEPQNRTCIRSWDVPSQAAVPLSPAPPSLSWWWWLMGCCARPGGPSIGCPMPPDTSGDVGAGLFRFECHPKPIPWSILALDRPAHKGCSQPSSWAEA